MPLEIEKKYPALETLFKKYEVEEAFLFGSATTKEVVNCNDIDFLYSFSSDLSFDRYASNYYKLEVELTKLLNKKVDLVAKKTLKNPYFIENINKSKIKII